MFILYKKKGKKVRRLFDNRKKSSKTWYETNQSLGNIFIDLELKYFAKRKFSIVKSLP